MDVYIVSCDGEFLWYNFKSRTSLMKYCLWKPVTCRSRVDSVHHWETTQLHVLRRRRSDLHLLPDPPWCHAACSGKTQGQNERHGGKENFFHSFCTVFPCIVLAKYRPREASVFTMTHSTKVSWIMGLRNIIRKVTWSFWSESHSLAIIRLEVWKILNA